MEDAGGAAVPQCGGQAFVNGLVMLLDQPFDFIALAEKLKRHKNRQKDQFGLFGAQPRYFIDPGRDAIARVKVGIAQRLDNSSVDGRTLQQQVAENLGFVAEMKIQAALGKLGARCDIVDRCGQIAALDEQVARGIEHGLLADGATHGIGRALPLFPVGGLLGRPAGLTVNRCYFVAT